MRTEGELRLSEDRLRLIIDTIPTMAWSLRPDGVLDFVNRRWLDYTGLSLEEELEEPARAMHPEDIHGAVEQCLVAAVEWAAEEFEGRTGTKCHVSLPGADIDLDPEHATALFRIFQETLTNVARHAKATKVSVRLANERGDVSLEVRDNGHGISEEQRSAASSLGILGMLERALLLGGELTIHGVPGQGTTVRVRIPAIRRTRPD